MNATGTPKRDPSRKPPTLAVLPEEVPIVLTALPQWVRWRWEWDQKRGAWTKIPIHPFYSKKSSTTDKTTWGTFQTVVSNLDKDDVDGIGFVFTASDPFCGVDLDSCRDPGTGEVTQDAHAIVEALRGYAEVSVTGTGVHIIVRASLGDLGGKKTGFLEVYDHARYFTVTGHLLVLPQEPS